MDPSTDQAQPRIIRGAGTSGGRNGGKVGAEAVEGDYARPEASEGASRFIAYASPYLFWGLVAVLLTGSLLL